MIFFRNNDWLFLGNRYSVKYWMVLVSDTDVGRCFVGFFFFKIRGLYNKDIRAQCDEFGSHAMIFMIWFANVYILCYTFSLNKSYIFPYFWKILFFFFAFLAKIKSGNVIYIWRLIWGQFETAVPNSVLYFSCSVCFEQNGTDYWDVRTYSHVAASGSKFNS